MLWSCNDLSGPELGLLQYVLLCNSLLYWGAQNWTSTPDVTSPGPSRGEESLPWPPGDGFPDEVWMAVGLLIPEGALDLLFHTWKEVPAWAQEDLPSSQSPDQLLRKLFHGVESIFCNRSWLPNSAGLMLIHLAVRTLHTAQKAAQQAEYKPQVAKPEKWVKYSSVK